MSRVTPVLLSLAHLFACASTSTNVGRSVGTVRVTLTIPDTLASTGVVTTQRLSEREVSSKAHQDPKHLFSWLEHVRRADDVDGDPRTITLVLPAQTQGTFVQVRYDTGGKGLDAMLGSDATVGTALVPIAPDVAAVSAALEAPLPRAPKEPCSGPRLEKLVLDAPELVRSGDPGAHVLCVYLPAHYADEPRRRYPVAFALPGFSGLAAQNDGFGARALFDSLGAELGVEAIIVGVETRTPEGTSYLARSARFGDWESYFVQRVLPEIDRRYRTQPRRAVYGHSTGGWNAMSIALRFPGLFVAVGASSPDPLDLDLWLFDAHGALSPHWRAWALAERALGGRGQFTSWAASWSPRVDGLDDLLDVDGDVRPSVLARWRAASPMSFVATPEGKESARRLSSRLFLTAGSADMFDLFRPTARFADALRAQGVDITWVPTALDHFGASDARFTPLVRFLLERLAEPALPCELPRKAAN